MKTAKVLLTLAFLGMLPGCGLIESSYYHTSEWTSRHWSAEKAWWNRRWIYADMPNRGSFKAGFKAGYRFACGGYDSCEPPQYRHYWRFGGLTESERQNARAWSDGFTHGTVAAQQDHAAGPSALDTAAMQPPPGVPDVRYYNPPAPNEMSDAGGFPGGGNQYGPMGQSPQPYEGQPYEGQGMPGYQYPPQTGYPTGENPQYQPNASNFQGFPGGDSYQYTPPTVPPPAPASEAAPAYSGPPQQLPPLPPPAPGNQPAVDYRYQQGPMMVSDGAPGIGSLRTVANLQPAPPAETAVESMPQQPVARPPRAATQANEWQLPMLRD